MPLVFVIEGSYYFRFIPVYVSFGAMAGVLGDPWNIFIELSGSGIVSMFFYASTKIDASFS